MHLRVLLFCAFSIGFAVTFSESAPQSASGNALQESKKDPIPKEKPLKDKILGQLNSIKTPLQSFATAMNAVASASNNKYFLLHSLNKVLINAGPALMLVGMALSIITAFLPQPDSKELAFMKEKFDVVINGLTRVENKLDSLEKLVMHEHSKTAYGEYQRIIQNLYLDWQYTVNATSKAEEEKNRAFFVKQYELHYQHSALNLLKAMTGQYDGELNNDLLRTAKERYKCDGLKLRKLCSAVTQTLVQGISVEGAFYAYTDMGERAEKEQEMWTERLALLEQTCENVLDECRDKWRDYALPPMWDTYNKFKTSSNQVLANEVFNTLTNTFGQRAWFVFVYNEVTGFKYHAVVYDPNVTPIVQKWRENDKMFSVVSVDMDKYELFDNQAAVNASLDSLRRGIADCKSLLPDEAKLEAGNTLVSVMSDEKVQQGLSSYVVKSDLNLAFVGTPQRYLTAQFRDRADCRRGVSYNFDAVSMG